MNDNLVLYILLMAVITYLTRFPLLLLSSRMELPGWLRRGLEMVPVGVFSSLTVPPILFHVREGSWSPEYLFAGIISLAVGLWKKQIILSLLAGVLAVVVWRAIVGV